MQQQAEPEMHNSSDATLYDRYALFTESEKNIDEYAPSFFRKNICNSYVYPFSQEDPMDTFTQSAKRFSLLLIFCTLTLVFSLNACGSQPGLTGSSSTLQQTPTTSSTVAPGTPQLTQQYDFTEQDSGRTVTYTVTSRFEITLNQQKYPKGNLRVSCSRAGTLGAISNLPAETPPLYAVRYEGVQAGRCTIQNGTFLLTVKIIA